MSDYCPNDMSLIAHTWLFTVEEIKRMSPEQVRDMADAVRRARTETVRPSQRVTDFPRSAEDIHE